MVINRIQDHFSQTSFATNRIAEMQFESFVPCPVFASMSACQQGQVLEIYRIAAELTREQLRPHRRAIPAFSMN